MDSRSVAYGGKEYICPLELAMDLIGGKWKPLMIFHLRHGALRSCDLQRTLTGISTKMFTQTARELERSGIISRQIHPVIPPRVDYSLTTLGESVVPVVVELARWGNQISGGHFDIDTCDLPEGAAPGGSRT